MKFNVRSLQTLTGHKHLHQFLNAVMGFVLKSSRNLATLNTRQPQPKTSRESSTHTRTNCCPRNSSIRECSGSPGHINLPLNSCYRHLSLAATTKKTHQLHLKQFKKTQSLVSLKGKIYLSNESDDTENSALSFVTFNTISLGHSLTGFIVFVDRSKK